MRLPTADGTATPTGHPRRRHRWTVVTLAAIGLLLGPLAGIASAHVGVTAVNPTQGGYTKVTFTVPTESNVPTTEIEVAMPTDTPIASVRVQPKDGWTYEVTTAAPATPLSDDDGAITEIVTRVVWTATGQGIKPGEFDEFNVSAGPLPTTDQVVFKVLQTYSDGEVVSWIQEGVEGAEEPEFPAPVLALAPAADAAATTSAADATTGDVPAVTDSAATSTTSGSGATTLAVIGLVVAVIAVAVAGFAITRTRRPTA